MRAIIPFLLFLISFGVYLKTLCPTVYVGDSGELIAAAYTLGIPHPPGYPLYCLLGRLFTFLSLGSIAYRVNLMSAFFASLTIVLVYLIVLKLLTIDHPTIQPSNHKTKMLSAIFRYVPAISASLLFAFSSTFWSQAVIAEVYTLNTFFLALSIFVLLKWKESLPTPNSQLPTPNSTRYLYLFAPIYGLSLTNHYIMGLFAAAFILFILWTRPKIMKEVRTLLLMLGLFLLPLLVYLYLPLRSLQNPPIDWGNPENLKNFWYHISARDYRNLIFSLSMFQTLGRMKEAFQLFTKQLSIIGLLIGAVGLWRLLKRDKSLIIFFLLIVLTNLFYIVFIDTASLKAAAFGIPSYVVIAIGIGYGIQYLIQKGGQINKSTKITLGGSNLYRYVASLLILVLPILPLSMNYFRNDRSRYYLAYDYGMNILKTLEKDAILFTSGDIPTFTTAYLTVVKKKRPDVTIYHRSSNLYQDIYGFYTGRRLRGEENRKQRSRIEREIISTTSRPVYYIRDVSQELSRYFLEPQGLVYRVRREGTEIKDAPNYWKDYQMRGMEDEGVFKDHFTRRMITEYYCRLGDHYFQREKRGKAVEQYSKASSIGWEVKGKHCSLGQAYQKVGMIDMAILEYEKAIEFRPHFASAHNNLGVCYAQKEQYQEAKREWEKALSINPGHEEAGKNLESLKNREQ